MARMSRDDMKMLAKMQAEEQIKAQKSNEEKKKKATSLSTQEPTNNVNYQNLQQEPPP